MKWYKVHALLVLIFISEWILSICGESTPLDQKVLQHNSSFAIKNEQDAEFLQLIQALWNYVSRYIGDNVERISAGFPLGSVGLGTAAVVGAPIILWALYLGLLMAHPKPHSDVKLERDISLTAMFLGNWASQMEDRFFDVLEQLTDPERKRIDINNHENHEDFFADYYEEDTLRQEYEVDYSIKPSVHNVIQQNHPETYPTYQSSYQSGTIHNQQQEMQYNHLGIFSGPKPAVVSKNQPWKQNAQASHISPLYQQGFDSIHRPGNKPIRHSSMLSISPSTPDNTPWMHHKAQNGVNKPINSIHKRPTSDLKAFNLPFVLKKMHPKEQEKYDNFTNVINGYVDNMSWDSQLSNYPNIPSYYNNPSFSRYINKTAKWPGKVATRSDYMSSNYDS